MGEGVLLEVQNITKHFPGVTAVSDTSIQLKKGEILGLVGENGAGKSTLMKILAGFYPHNTFEGHIILEGQPRRFSSVAEAQAAGIVMIPQELAVAPHMTVAENIFLNHEPNRYGILDRKELYLRSQEFLDSLNAEVDAHALMESLGYAKQQLVVIMAALSKKARVLILDEPTSPLSEAEAETLFEKLRLLKQSGVSCLYITHRLHEVAEITDQLVIMRDGKIVATDETANLSPSQIVSYMIGREVGSMYPKETVGIRSARLAIRDLSVHDPELSEKVLVQGIDIEVRGGEIVGLFGLLGSGKTETAMALFGAWPGKVSKEVYVDGQKVEISSPVDAVHAGIGLVTEDRRQFGLIGEMNVQHNITLAALHLLSRLGIIRLGAEVELTQHYISQLNIMVPSVTETVRKLSGGNQQKVVLGKWLAAKAKVLVLDEPTRGIDVGAKTEVYRLLNDLAKEGMGILFISSELPEIMGMCDRILVMHNGMLVGEFQRGQVNGHEIMRCAGGG